MTKKLLPVHTLKLRWLLGCCLGKLSIEEKSVISTIANHKRVPGKMISYLNDTYAKIRGRK